MDKQRRVQQQNGQAQVWPACAQLIVAPCIALHQRATPGQTADPELQQGDMQCLVCRPMARPATSSWVTGSSGCGLGTAWRAKSAKDLQVLP